MFGVSREGFGDFMVWAFQVRGFGFAVRGFRGLDLVVRGFVVRCFAFKDRGFWGYVLGVRGFQVHGFGFGDSRLGFSGFWVRVFRYGFSV